MLDLFVLNADTYYGHGIKYQQRLVLLFQLPVPVPVLVQLVLIE